jgi:hypothetical protein
MRLLVVVLGLFIVSCGTTFEKLEQQAMACKNSLVQDENGGVRKRTQAEVDRDCEHLFQKATKAWDARHSKRENHVPKCPAGKVAVCRGPSCGSRIRRHQDAWDWSCQDRESIMLPMGGFYGTF